MKNRLTDIKDDVEHSDNSLREEVQHGADEYVLRRWLARKLAERARQRCYTIPQEEEIDQKERPDLRAENPHTAPVSIELKWADNWTLTQLVERLENQLVGQYLRAERSRYGIHVLATDGRKGYWESPHGKLDFNQVIERVARRAEELRSTRLGIGDLRVVAIDWGAGSGMSQSPARALPCQYGPQCNSPCGTQGGGSDRRISLASALPVLPGVAASTSSGEVEASCLG